jgi:DNA-directed RNA polymerase specialized sigma24 family protein
VDKASEAEFREFVAGRSLELMRRAFVLVGGDYEAAEDLVQVVLAKVASRWADIDEPIAYVRTIMYRQQISWWRRGWSRMETPSADLPDCPTTDAAHATDVKLTVRAALFRLTPRQRAVLFLWIRRCADDGRGESHVVEDLHAASGRPAELGEQQCVDRVGL